jgi:hypothetical protein
VRSYYAHGVASPAGYLTGQPPAPAAPASSWVLFATNDPATRVRTQHARLRAEPPQNSVRHAGDFLELTGVAHDHAAAVLTLASVPAATCPSIDHVEAAFDARQPRVFETEPAADDGVCALKIDAFDRLLDEILNAQTLVVKPSAPGTRLQDVVFRVGGLSWGSE